MLPEFLPQPAPGSLPEQVPILLAPLPQKLMRSDYYSSYHPLLRKDSANTDQ
ncbi:Uncharacterised protein [Shigella sonnei]|nr:Uncharacterised protein [Shigella sonnei]